MPVQTLTNQFLSTLPSIVPTKGATSFFDTEIKGFILEHRASGGATYYFRYRDAAQRLRMARIGRLADLTLATARARAHAMRQLLLEGGDPAVERHRFADVPTLADMVHERYLPYAKLHKRSWATDECVLRLHLLPVFGAYRIHRIQRADVVKLMQAVRQQGYAAGTCNRILVLLKYVLNCAIRWDLMPPGNPCQGVTPFEDEGARERYLSEKELARLFQELEGNTNVQVAQVIRLLLLTGARKREVLDARWSEIDMDRQLLTVPAARSKSKKPRHIPLSDAAMALLRDLPRQDDVPWVFFNPRTGKPPVSIFYAWDTIRNKVGMSDVRLHDLRHSYASFLVNAGRSLYEVQKLLGHHSPKVTMRYAHLSPEAMLEAANVVGKLVTTALPL